MSEPFWQTKFKGAPIRIGLGDLSLHRLREMKHTFGEAYGIPTEFINLLLRGDMDAMACAVWIGQQKAGGEITHPRDMDFTLDDFEALEDPKPKSTRKKRDPTAGDQTPDSQQTSSTTSEPDTSGISSTSEE